MKLTLHKSGEIIHIEPTPFAGGGEGNLFHIADPLRMHHRYIVKIYHPHKLTAERQEKLRYLLNNTPIAPSETAENNAVIWVQDLVYDSSGKLLGFIMPFTRGDKLELLTSLKIPKNADKAWRRFDLKNKEALNYRMRLCFNIAVALQQVHSTERYILVDLKPDNIVVQPHGIIALVDMDSVEVVQEGKSLYDAPVATPEYTPPEHYRSLDRDPTSSQAWDRFSMAVIYYKLLFGIHPFAAGSQGKHEQCLNLEQKIEAGLYVDNPAIQEHISVIPPPHKAFNSLHKDLKTLFSRAFVDGHQDPELRPTAEEWCVGLLNAIDDPRLQAIFGHLILPTAPKDIKINRRKLSEAIALPEYNAKQADKIVPDWLMKLDQLEKPPTIQPKLLSDYDYIKFNKQLVQGFNWTVGTSIFGILTVLIFLDFQIVSFVSDLLEPIAEILENILRSIDIDGDGVVFFAMLGLGIISFFSFTRLLRYIYYHFTKEVSQKGRIEKNLNLSYMSFRQLWEELQGYTQQINSISNEAYIEEVLEQNQARIASLKNSLIEQDPEVEQLREMERAAYLDLHNDYLQKALNDPMLADLDGQSLREMREQLLNNKVASEAWMRAKAALDDIFNRYQADFQLLKKSFDESYQKLLAEARKKLDDTLLAIAEEEEQAKERLEEELSSRIPLSKLEKLQSQLNQERIKLEVLETEKERYKEVSFKNFRKVKK